MTEWISKGIASLSVLGAGVLAVGLPDDADGWTVLMEKFGVLAFVIVCAVLGLAFIVPRALTIFEKYLERQDARADSAQQAYLQAMEKRDAAQEKMADSIDRLADKIDDLTKD